MANSQAFYTTLGIAKESSFGTAAVPVMWLPIDPQPRMQPAALRHTMDQGARGKRAKKYDIIAGPGEGTFQFGGSVYADSIGHLLMNLFGTDTVATTSVTVNSVAACQHSFSLNAAPPSHTLQWGQNVQAYNFTGSRLSQFTVNFNARDGALTYQAQGTSKIATTVSASTASLEGLTALPGWNGAVTVAGGAPASLMEGSLAFAVGLKPVHALNATQDVATIYALELDVTGRLTFDFTQTTEYNYFDSASGTKNALVLGWTQPSLGQAVTVTITKAGWRLVDLEVNDNIYTAVAQIDATYNATDVGPAAVTLANAQTTGY